MFNSLISLDFTEGIKRNLGFIRILILFAAFNYFFLDKVFLSKVLSFWTYIISFLLIDVLVESITGTNLIGYGGNYGKRIVSFLKMNQLLEVI